jgi:hypothetical protein
MVLSKGGAAGGISMVVGGGSAAGVLKLRGSSAFFVYHGW